MVHKTGLEYTKLSIVKDTLTISQLTVLSRDVHAGFHLAT